MMLDLLQVLNILIRKADILAIEMIEKEDLIPQLLVMETLLSKDLLTEHMMIILLKMMNTFTKYLHLIRKEHLVAEFQLKQLHEFAKFLVEFLTLQLI